jgi:hypothetical protein
MVLCWIDTKLAQLSVARIQLPLAELFDRSLELAVPLASRGTGQLEQPYRGTHQSFLVAHVIAEPRIILLDEGDQIVRTRPRPEATDNPPHKCASWVKKALRSPWALEGPVADHKAECSSVDYRGRL